MSKRNTTVRLAPEAVSFLDQLAEHLDRDRSYLIKCQQSGESDPLPAIPN